jgi:hypothetical protein
MAPPPENGSEMTKVITISSGSQIELNNKIAEMLEDGWQFLYGGYDPRTIIETPARSEGEHFYIASTYTKPERWWATLTKAF